jgi:hypothetical protein
MQVGLRPPVVKVTPTGCQPVAFQSALQPVGKVVAAGLQTRETERIYRFAATRSTFTTGS